MRIKLTAWLAALLALRACSCARRRRRRHPTPAAASAPAGAPGRGSRARRPAPQARRAGLAGQGGTGGCRSPATEAVADIKEAGSNLARDFRRWVADTRGHVGRHPRRRRGDPAASWRGSAITSLSRSSSRDFGRSPSSPGASCSWATASSSSSGWALEGWRKRVLATPLDTVAAAARRGRAAASAYNLLWLLSFAVGSLGALLLFNWPPYLKIAAQRDLPDHRRRHPLGARWPGSCFRPTTRNCGSSPPATRRHGIGAVGT